MSLRVIGTGFGRTGTDSMREALTMLGFGPCHHMYEVMAHAEQKRLWRALAKGGAPNWDRLFAGYESCVDWPSAHYWRELIEAYPQARVILTWRSPEGWWESFQRTILPAIADSKDQDSLGVALVAKQVFGGHPRSPYARVDAIRSSRHIRVELDGVVLAESAAPVLLFETGLPTRHYIQRTDVFFAHLERTDTVTHCPYKGTTSDYWSARAGERVHRDVAWSYAYPDVAVAAIAGLVAFYDEKVDTFLDGVPVTRPRTKFHGGEGS